jgi:hypothetical protein
MDSLAILKNLVAYLEPRREAWPKVGKMNGYGKSYRPSYDVNVLVNGSLAWNNIVDTAVYYLFHDVDVPVKQYSCRGGFSTEKEIQEYINSVAYSVFSVKFPNMYEGVRGCLESGMEPTPWNMSHGINRLLSGVKIETTSVEEYLGYLIELEDKYDTDPSYLEYFIESIQKIEALEKEKEERLKAAAEALAQEKERIRIEELQKVKVRKMTEKEKKAAEEAKEFELEVRRRVKLELYERRVKAEVDRRLKALVDAKAPVVPVEEVVVQAMEVKAAVEEAEEKPQEKKPLSILERFKSLF